MFLFLVQLSLSLVTGRGAVEESFPTQPKPKRTHLLQDTEHRHCPRRPGGLPLHCQSTTVGLHSLPLEKGSIFQSRILHAVGFEPMTQSENWRSIRYVMCAVYAMSPQNRRGLIRRMDFNVFCVHFFGEGLQPTTPKPGGGL